MRDHQTLVQRGLRLLHFGQARLRVTAASFGLAFEAGDDLLDRLQVGQDQLGLDRGDVARRIDAAVDVNDVVVDEDANDFTDRVALSDRGEELIAETFALRGAFDDARDVDEGHGGRQDLL